ncbi:MAG: glycine zipper family protein [Burkholderiales bacterium]|nr:glycine zipper family protein [Burkholderiales bacterium]
MVLMGAITAGLTAGCTQTGPRSSSAAPVLYPNEAFKQLGADRAQAESQSCQGRAQEAGLSPQLQDGAVGRSAAEGAAVGGSVGAVTGLLSGHPQRALSHAATGAVAGGTAGAVHGAFHDDKPNPTYRNFVSRCLKERGLEVIGWN